MFRLLPLLLRAVELLQAMPSVELLAFSLGSYGRALWYHNTLSSYRRSEMIERSQKTGFVV